MEAGETRRVGAETDEVEQAVKGNEKWLNSDLLVFNIETTQDNEDGSRIDDSGHVEMQTQSLIQE